MSSRIFGKLANGRYKLVATAFSNVAVNIGPYQLKVKFYPDCLPQCDGNRQCGSDGCGGVCGTCVVGQECHLESGRCRADPCVAKCSYLDKEDMVVDMECGDDGCGGVCGSCDLLNGMMCQHSVGLCKQIGVCDNLVPECLGKPPGSMAKPYCGYDCLWHDMKERLGDLMPNGRELVVPTIEFDWRNVSERSCVNVEGCLRHSGMRNLMRFDTYVHNVG